MLFFPDKILEEQNKNKCILKFIDGNFNNLRQSRIRPERNRVSIHTTQILTSHLGSCCFHEGAHLGRADSWAGQDCGELESCPAAVSPGQGDVALEGWNGVLGLTQGGERPGAGQGQQGLVVPSRPWQIT